MKGYLYMRLKVVIVEDNLITIRSLTETIDWDALDCDIVGTARDGDTGKQVILDTKPDILLSDIRMPQCDGLDMIEAVRADIPDCKIIIITGYDQFQYASRAIKMAVFDYLLKPIRNDEVIGAVKRAGEEILKRRSEADSLQEMDRFRRQAQLLSLLTNPAQKGQGVHTIIEGLGVSFEAYYIMTVQIDGEEAFSQSALNHLDRVIAGKHAEAVTCLLYDTLVAFITRGRMDDTWRAEAEGLADSIIREMAMPVHIGVSGQNRSTHEIRQVYQQSRQAMWEAALLKEKASSVMFYAKEQDRHLPSQQIAEFNARIASLIEVAELSDDSARRAAQELVALSGHQYSQLRALIAMYSLELRKKFGAPADLTTDQAMYESWFVTRPDEVEACLLKMCAALRQGSEEHYSLLTQNTLQYIKLHAVEGLQLNTVAEMMCVSGNYLSALIRKETGITYHEHVLNAKMAVARTMLSDPRILVEEVAHAVGYSNYISFYNAFKRVEHMTPTEYRNGKVTM